MTSVAWLVLPSSSASSMPLKKVAESPSAQQVVDLLRQEEADRIEHRRQTIQLAGWIALGAGLGVGLLLSQLVSVPGLWRWGHPGAARAAEAPPRAPLSVA